MNDKEIIVDCKINTWAFKEAERILKKIDYKIPKKGYVLFETGYGPSGLPHIGTFGEVIRTKYVMFAFQKLAPYIPIKIFVISDDYDALRKIPENIPNKELLKKYIGMPLSLVPDPYETEISYGSNMNNRLKTFLNNFNLEYEFVSSSDYYKKGIYNETIKLFADHYDQVSDYIKSTIGDERASTYHPFMPIDNETNEVVQDNVLFLDKNKYTIKYINKLGKEKEISIFDGNIKLQWKCDFAMRWIALDVDYEIYGKDVATNAIVYSTICDILKSNKPINMQYELFLDEEGKKISKSKGNGLTIESWMKYANQDSLMYYMFLKPQTAKKLFFDVIPKAVDEYLTLLLKFHSQEEKDQFENPVYYVHFGDVPKYNIDISYSMLLNLASTCNTENEDILLGFIKQYNPDIEENHNIIQPLIKGAINYYKDFIEPNKKYKTADTDQRKFLIELRDSLLKQNDNIDAKSLQDILYDIGNRYGDLKQWFITLYECLLGLSSGPRFGTFIKIYGIKNVITLINDTLNRS